MKGAPFGMSFSSIFKYSVAYLSSFSSLTSFLVSHSGTDLILAIVSCMLLMALCIFLSTFFISDFKSRLIYLSLTTVGDCADVLLYSLIVFIPYLMFIIRNNRPIVVVVNRDIVSNIISNSFLCGNLVLEIIHSSGFLHVHFMHPSNGSSILFSRNILFLYHH